MQADENSEAAGPSGEYLLTATQKAKILYDISNSLQDLSTINEVLDMDGVALVAPLLTEPSAQLRKYAVFILAELANSVKGQIAIMSDDVLPRVIQMINDPMPNVASAACMFQASVVCSLSLSLSCALTSTLLPLLRRLLSPQDFESLQWSTGISRQ